MNKEEIRDKAKKIRREMKGTEEKSLIISGKALEVLDGFKSVMIYVSAFKEPDTLRIIKKLLESGKNVAVPVSNTDNFTITPVYIENLEDLKRGAYGILEPKRIIKANMEDIDIVIVPGIAFDRNLNRIGFGKGYYDRLLKGLSVKKIALCYYDQIFDEIPAEDFDIKMDMIITEKETIGGF